MPKNLELKARIASVSDAIRISQQSGFVYKGCLHQKDIYFYIKKDRLKLRIINGKSAEIIYYRRKNRRGGRYSDFLVLPVMDFRTAGKMLSSVFRKGAIVEKKREFFICGNSRIHIDQVKHLGRFIEFEVPLLHGKPQAVRRLNHLQKTYNIGSKDIIAGSYSDLMRKVKKRR
jgi:predicted adenylyl cyclase CyaB